MTIIDSLHEDHVNIAEIAGLAREELRQLEAGEAADYGLLEDIMCYVTGYPDTHHHPTEDIVFEYLKRCVPAAAEDVEAILAEHEELIASGIRFLEAIRAVEEEAVVRRDELLRRGHGYLSMLEAHMNTEESLLFPRVTQALSSQQWQELDDRIEQRPDPLFGAAVDADYRRLWQRIQAHRRHQVDEQH